MTHPVRLLARYAADFEVYVQCDIWSKPKRFQAKDVSPGGLFLRTTSALEIFAELQLRVLLPWGGELNVLGRAVHMISEEKAVERGWHAGAGIEFQDLTVEERTTIHQLAAWARAGDPGCCVPRLIANEASTEINPILAYVLAAVDGKRSIDQIAKHLKVAPAAAESMLIQLNGMELVHLGDHFPQMVTLTLSPLPGSLTDESSTTPSLDVLRQHLIDAANACAEDDLEAAARSLVVFAPFEWGTPDLRKGYEEVTRKVNQALDLARVHPRSVDQGLSS